MPPEAKCPWCETIVPDWHFEWHTQQDQREIYAGNKAMQCPVCHAGVAFDGFVLTKAPAGQAAVLRELLIAARWARIQNKSLADYLKTSEGQPFMAFWTEPEVATADQQAAAQEQE
jgi:hypothetical protein